jgi:hypothetical protein
MRRVVAVAAVLTSLFAVGCAGWQANKGSQAIDIDPTAIGTADPVIQPSNGGGFVHGEPLNMRTK